MLTFSWSRLITEAATELFGFTASIFTFEYPGLSLGFDIEIVKPRLDNVVNELTCALKMRITTAGKTKEGDRSKQSSLPSMGPPGTTTLKNNETIDARSG